MNVASFVSSIGFSVDKASVAKVDKTIDHIEARLLKLGTLNRPIKLNLSGFAVDQGKLNIALGTALDIASERLVFHVARFHVDQAALNRDVGLALNRASAGHRMAVNPAVSGAVAGAAAGRGARGGLALSSVYGPALAVAMGGYGMSRLNKLNQKVVAAELQSQAVVMQAGGTEQEGSDSNEWLKRQADRVGFNYLDSVQGYNNTLAGMTHAGMSVQQGQKVFKGFSEIGRVMKLDAVHQKRLLYAVSEVADMNELQKRQMNMIALALPGGKSLFAEAWQKKTGGKLHGQEAEAELLAAIKARKVKGDILLPVAELASERAAPNLDKASKASQAEEAHYQNALAREAVVASENGVEEGFARIFRTLTAGLDESGGLVKIFAEGFNEATKEASKLLLFPQDFMRAMEGKDSLVADWLGKGQTTELKKDWEEIKNSVKELFNLPTPVWLPSLKDVAQTLKDIIHVPGAISSTVRNSYNEGQQIQQDDIDHYGDDTGTRVLGLVKANYHTFKNVLKTGGEGVGFGLNKILDTLPFAHHTPVSGLMEGAANYLQGSNDQGSNDGMSAGQSSNLSVTSTNTVDITVKIDPTTLASEDSSKLAKLLGDAVKEHVGDLFGQVQVNYPTK